MNVSEKTTAASVPDFTAARYNMVESQLRPNKVTDRRILDAMGLVPRELFLPPLLAGIAYSDEDTRIAADRFLMEPMILARLLQEANITSSDRVLDIASATGYSTIILAALAKHVVGLESDPSLVTQAVKNLPFMNVSNAELQLGSLTKGWEASAPYDVIFLNGSVEVVPDVLFAQLNEGGRLMAVVQLYGPGHMAHWGEARLYEKVHGVVSHRALFDANIQPLPGFKAPATFTFE